MAPPSESETLAKFSQFFSNADAIQSMMSAFKNTIFFPFPHTGTANVQKGVPQPQTPAQLSVGRTSGRASVTPCPPVSLCFQAALTSAISTT